MEETKQVEGQTASDEGELVVQELFFESYDAPQTAPNDSVPTKEERAAHGLVGWIVKNGSLGLVMLGSLLIAGLSLASHRRRHARFAPLKKRLGHLAHVAHLH